MTEEDTSTSAPAITLTDEDVYDAMSHVSGFLDISTEDFREIYLLAYRHAVERLVGNLRAVDVVARDVISVHADTPWDEVGRLMAYRGVKSVPVTDDDNRVTGIVSQTDFLRHFHAANFMAFVMGYLDSPGELKHTLHALKASDVMTRPAVTLREDAAFPDMIKVFKTHPFSRVPVVDSHHRLVGIISRKDFVRSCPMEAL